MALSLSSSKLGIKDGSEKVEPRGIMEFTRDVIFGARFFGRRSFPFFFLLFVFTHPILLDWIENEPRRLEAKFQEMHISIHTL